MPPAELEGLRETFEAIDRNHSGTISLEELTSHLQVKILDRHAKDFGNLRLGKVHTASVVHAFHRDFPRSF